MNIRTRIEPAANYRSVFHNGKTIRMPIDPKSPLRELRWPEFLDIGINSWCAGGCTWCYTSATKRGYHFPKVVEKVLSFFGDMILNQRPYQVAIGGSGESTAHPDFIAVLKAFHSLQIVPNYTTNGMHLTDEVMAATHQYCGGVALSCHPHLKKVWQKAADQLLAEKVRTNVHIIISDRESIDYCREIYDRYNGQIEYFVLLPYMNVGFGGGSNAKQIDYSYLEAWLDGIAHYGNIAFGSNFYPWLKQMRKYGVSLYEPESCSKYLIMDDQMQLYNNSFEMKPVAWNPQEGCILESRKKTVFDLTAAPASV